MDITWQQWVICIWILIGMLSTVYITDKPREPITPGVSVASVVINFVLIALVLSI